MKPNALPVQMVSANLKNLYPEDYINEDIPSQHSLNVDRVGETPRDGPFLTSFSLMTAVPRESSFCVKALIFC